MRLSLCIPLKIGLKHSDGTFVTFDARTTVVNKNGARVESELPPPVDQEVIITVPGSGNSATARVAWASKDKNSNGYCEFGVELEEAENLWGVRFPPADWKWPDSSP